MTPKEKSLKIGIIGCGAIGSRMAQSIKNDLKGKCRLVAVYDIEEEKASELQKELKIPKLAKTSVKDLIKSCDLVVEAINARDTRSIIKQALDAKKHVLVMSVGKLLNAKDLLNISEKNRTALLFPSGAIAGIDAIKAASLVPITSVTLTTRKPPASIALSSHIAKKGIDLRKIKKETVIFDGDVDTAVQLFPQNINVAATLALASHAKSNIRVKILTSPKFTRNSHEIEVVGDFGRIVTRTDNLACPDNPKTSYLAVLSGIQTLAQFCSSVKIGT